MTSSIGVNNMNIQRLVRLVFIGALLSEALQGLIQFYFSVSISISSFYRFALILYVINMILNNHIKYSRDLLTILILLIGYLSVWMVFYGNSYFFREVEQFVRIIYPIALFMFLIKAVKNNWVNVLFIYKQIVYAGVISSIFLVFSYATGIGNDTYGDYSFGVASFFGASNDITLNLLLTLSISLLIGFYHGKTLFVIFSLVILIGLILLGTRAGTIGGGAIVFLHIVFVTFSRRNKFLSIGKKFFFLLFVSVGIIFTIFKTYDKISEYNHTIERYQSLVSESPRKKLESAGESAIKEMTLGAKIFGMGSVMFCLEVERSYASGKDYNYGKWVEQDLYDFIGSYGFILGFAFLYFHYKYFFKSLVQFIRTHSYVSAFILLTISIFVIHSMMAGHAVNSPTAASVVVILYIHYIVGSKTNKEENENKKNS